MNYDSILIEEAETYRLQVPFLFHENLLLYEVVIKIMNLDPFENFLLLMEFT